MIDDMGGNFCILLIKIMDLRNYLASTRNSIKNSLLKKTTRIFFCHVPKCAGTALSRAISIQTYPVYQRLLVPNYAIDLEAGKKAAIICNLSKVEARQVINTYNLSLNRYKYGHGHVYCRPGLVDSFRKKWHFITILRNPVDRWISEYTYNTYKDHKWAKNTLAINDYIKSEKGKGTGESFLRYFSNIPYPYEGDPQFYIDEAVENLKSFTVVGSVEHFDKWCSRFEQVFGKRLVVERSNTSPKKEISEHIRHDQQIMKQIEKLCEADTQIYHRTMEMIKKGEVIVPIYQDSH